MRSMRYTVHTICLTISNDGELLTLGSRDKYVFNSSQTSTAAELYVFRFTDGRNTKVDNKEYELKIFALAGCGGLGAPTTADVYLETGDILLGISSLPTENEQDVGGGCTPYLYILRPIFSRNPGNTRQPLQQRGCGGGGD